MSDEQGMGEEARLLGLGSLDPDEARIVRSGARVFAPMIERFMHLDLSLVPIEAAAPYGGAPAA
ncbi:MAG: hypothetical protein JWR30_1211 [Conexibacter sp.]|nr:hypothetical protein [Conexibacter sp.]MCZ4492724.1 hypothetical protein [Conexibacter sp.]MDX6715604.1 hypothetical protein [Baekduia sp.]MDX6731746.1 hypothetical protein [Baekduia sp.]